MKKILCLVLLLVFLPVASLAGEELNVFNCEDYINEDVLDLFTQETGITINYMNYTDNEIMITTLETNPGGFDVVFPSDYMVERMVNEGLAMPLDFSLIPNFVNIRQDLLDPSYDAGNAHSVPYMWGTLGILYNTALVDEEDVHTWAILWSEKYPNQVMMMDSLRDAMTIALKYLGYSPNTDDYFELREAADLLIAQKRSGAVKAYGLDEIKDKMILGEAAIGVVYSGDAQYAIEEAAAKGMELRYVIPDEGSNCWVDCAVIPSTAKNVENAYKFIDFLCRPEIAAMNVEAIWYMCVNTPAIELMGEEYTSKPPLNPTAEELARCEYHQALDALTLEDYTTLYQEVKNAR